MKNERHPSKAELVQVLDNEFDVVLTETTEHLKQCETCQQELDALAANPEQWQKALQFLKDAEIDWWLLVLHEAGNTAWHSEKAKRRFNLAVFIVRVARSTNTP